MSSEMRYTDDDLRVIVQDWSESDPDQAVAINLARECLRHRALLARTEAGAVDRISIKLTTDRKEGEPEGAEWWTWKREQLEAEGWVMESECADGAELFVRPKDAAPVADGAVAFRWKSGGTANKPRWVYAEAGSKSIPPVGAHPLFTHPQDASAKDAEIAMLRETLRKIDDRLTYGMDRAGSSLERKRTMCDAVAFARAALHQPAKGGAL